MKPFLFTFILLFLFVPGAAAQEGDYLGCFGFGCNSFDPDSLANEFGAGSFAGG